MKKLLSLVLFFVLVVSMPAQATVKKVTSGVRVGENPIDYPKITTWKTQSYHKAQNLKCIWMSYIYSPKSQNIQIYS